MYKLLIIAHREYAAMVATRAFLVTLIMMPVLMFGGLILMPKLSQLGGGQTQRILVADGTGKLLPILQAAGQARNEALRQATVDTTKTKMEQASEETRNRLTGAENFFEIEPAPAAQLTDQQRLELSDQIRSGQLYAFVELPGDLMQSERAADSQARFFSQDSLLSSARQWIAAIVSEQVRVTRLGQLGLDPVVVGQASRPVELVPTAPIKVDEAVNQKSQADMLVALFVPFGIMMLMFMVIFLAAQPMLESGMEEKSHRIAEVLLGSVNPTELMTGKLLGNVAGSLMIFAIYGIGGWVVMQRNGWNAELPMSVVPWFIVFQLLGVLFFSSIFLTVGASISELKEAQSILMPIWLVMLAPLMIWFLALREPNGPVATSLSMFPPSAPLMMMLRLSSGQAIPWWQPFVSAGLLVVATALVVLAAGRIYRASLLRTDSVRTLAQFLARVR